MDTINVLIVWYGNYISKMLFFFLKEKKKAIEPENGGVCVKKIPCAQQFKADWGTW